MPEWTTDLPDTPGWYWHTDNRRTYDDMMTNIIHVTPVNDGELVACISGKEVNIQSICGMWYGPIETPPAPERKNALVLREGMSDAAYAAACTELVREGYIIHAPCMSLHAPHENSEIRKIADYTTTLAKVSLVCAPCGYANNRILRTVVSIASMYEHIRFRRINIVR